MRFFDRTAAVIEKTLKDLVKLSFWIAVIVQALFLILYGFKIYLNLTDHPYYLVIYSSLAAISTIGFIVYVVTFRARNDKAVKVTNRFIRFCKYLANTMMIVVLLVEFTQREVSDLEIVVSGISVVSLLLQLVMEFIRILYEKYSELITTALSLDLDRIPIGKSVYELIDSPLKNLANKITGKKVEEKPLTKAEARVEELAKTYSEKDKAKKAKRKEDSKQRVLGSLKTIFGRKKKDNDTEQ